MKDIVTKLLNGFHRLFAKHMILQVVMTSSITSTKRITNIKIWKRGFRRIIAGQPSAAFDTELIEEWRLQPAAVRQAVRSALHFSIHTAERKALFICTHSIRGYFSCEHLQLARRFSILATQALQTLEFESKLASLKEKLETEAKLAALNQKLIESEKKTLQGQEDGSVRTSGRRCSARPE